MAEKNILFPSNIPGLSWVGLPIVSVLGRNEFKTEDGKGMGLKDGRLFVIFRRLIKASILR